MDKTNINAARSFARKTLKDLIPAKLVKKIDRDIFAYCDGDVENYNKRMYSIFGIVTSSCDNNCESNVQEFLNDLRQNIVGVEMKCFEKYREQQRIDDSKYDIQIDVADGAISCFKCGSSKVFQHHKQTRSADEATTIFYTCANKECGKRWRVG